MRRSSTSIAGPALRRIAPSTPPPMISGSLAAFTIDWTARTLMSACTAASLAAMLRAFHPCSDKMMGNRDPRRKADPVDRIAGEQRTRSRAVNPARVGELRLVDANGAVERFRETTDHERRGKGPGLRGEITDVSDSN